MLAKLSAANFRIIDRAEVVPSSGFNILCGANGQGKTTFLEAIHLVSTGRLWKGAKDIQAIQDGQNETLVSAELTQSGTELAVHIVRGSRRKALVNSLGLPRASDLLGRLPTVSFSAVDLEIVRGEPADRRDFLDEELAQLYPAYLRHLAAYKRAVEQRNALLRQARDYWQGAEVFEPWEESLAEHGQGLRTFRTQWLNEITPLAAAHHAQLSEGEVLNLAYMPKDEGLSPRTLAATRGEDIARGSTSLGPHRDEVLITISGREGRVFASQGQQRTAVISLKLAVQSLAQRVFGFPPLLLLDDVFSDLDARRRGALVDFAQSQQAQVFLSCTESEMAGSGLVSQSTVFRVESGRISKD